jgi:hypothetical protein
MEEMDIVESRSSSRKRFMPQKCDLERMEDVGEILRENYEIRSFRPVDEANKPGEKMDETEVER